jgi:nucleotide-binding universal stress UspA family protein
VPSTHRGPVGRVLAGTTAERLLTGSPCPVALAPRGYAAAQTAIGSVIVGYDGSEEARAALDVAVDIARRAEVELTIVAVAEPASVYVTEAAIDLTDLVGRTREHAEHVAAEGAARIPDDVVARAEVVTGDPGPALASRARAETDVLVVGSRRYGPPRSVLVGTVGHHLAREAASAVLIVPRGVEIDRAGELLSAPAATG